MKIKPLTMTPEQLINMVPGTIEEYVAQQRGLKERRREQDAINLGDGTPDEDQPEGVLASPGMPIPRLVGRSTLRHIRDLQKPQTHSEALREQGLEISDLVRDPATETPETHLERLERIRQQNREYGIERSIWMAKQSGMTNRLIADMYSAGESICDLCQIHLMHSEDVIAAIKEYKVPLRPEDDYEVGEEQGWLE